MKKLFAVLLPAVLIVGLGFACHRNKEARIDFAASRISSQLDLTDEQEAKLKEVTQVVKDQMKQKRDMPHDELKALLSQPTLDADQSKAFFEKHKAEMTSRADAIYAAVFPKLAAFHASLTDEQRVKAVELMDKFHKRWGRH